MGVFNLSSLKTHPRVQTKYRTGIFDGFHMGFALSICYKRVWVFYD